MRKMRMEIILLVGFLSAILFSGLGGAKADEPAMINNENQVLNDEGYGNDDVEYYNSEDNSINDAQ